MRKASAMALAALLVALGALQASAEIVDDPELTDPAGDANFVNNQGLPNDPGSHDTRPASVDGVDIRAISFDTAYVTSQILGEDGSVERVVYTPTGLDITVEMEGDVLPTAGPSMGVRIPVDVNGCESVFQSWWRGTLQDADRGFQQSEIRKLGSSCPGGANTIATDFGQTIEGKTVTMHYPFSAFTGALTGFLASGMELGPAPTYLNSQNNPYTTTQQFVGQSGAATVHLYTTIIDQAPRFDSYVIGSDVPASVNCALTPDHPDCQL